MISKLISRLMQLSVTAKFFLLFILIVIFEGALRKWVGVPTTLLLALRDLVALTIVLMAAMYNRFSVMPRLSFLVSTWSVMLISFSIIQTIINETPVVILLIGWRFWLLYLWLALAVACSLSKADFVFIAKILMSILIFIMLPLTLVQSTLPPSHILNTQPDTDVSRIFTLAGDTVRATGTFSFTLGLTSLLSLLIPFAFSGRFMQEQLFKSKTMYLAGLLAISMLAIFSGSRAAVIWIAGMFVIFSLSEFVVNQNKEAAKRIVGMGFFAFILVIIVNLFFLENLNAYRERFYVASRSEDILNRFKSILFGEPHVIPNFSLLGEGLGLGSNAGGTIISGINSFLLAETEPGRNLLEAGIMGLIWILIKYIAGAYALVWGLYSLKKNRDIMPFLLTITCLFAFVTWPVSGQISANAIAYILLSFLLFYIKEYKYNVRVNF